MSQEALLYHPGESSGVVICDLCRHRCEIREGKRGFCKARRNVGGRLVSLVYGRPVALTPDPIEKKPMFHFLPGTLSMSTATVGCNFTCDFCQNSHISQYLRDTGDSVPGDWIEPEEIVSKAVARACRSISFTYTEPTIYFEFALETARLARDRGLAVCFVSNGFMTPEAIAMLTGLLQGINVDLKCHDERTYRRIMGGRLEGVLDSLVLLRAAGVWIEITTLLIEGINDSPQEIERIARFIVEELGPEVPWHVSRFLPQYRRTGTPPTSSKAILSALEIGRKVGLRYVYSGNMRDDRTESTWCHACGAPLIIRSGYSVRENNLTQEGVCAVCKEPCAGFWDYQSSRPEGDCPG